jgi:pyrimidine operon attenuation protein/uracil phosphoribosyltransferase
MRTLADQAQVAKLIEQLAAAIDRDAQSFKSNGPWALVGLRSRGDDLARRLAAILKPDHLGTLDFTLYRDDLGDAASQPLVRATEIDFSIDKINVVLVDDVLMTGRSVRAALQSLMDLGRPRRVWLSVLVDRGGRELPIAADHVALDLRAGKGTGNREQGTAEQGTVIAVGPDEVVEVRLKPTDDRDAIVVRAARNRIPADQRRTLP